ncbi:MAG: FAD-binding oxidoreductase [Candidatus Melainabacteria bacterium]|nr:FAD-binding oxidoreductase [Candidatus Melainabacteria bacterium]
MDLATLLPPLSHAQLEAAQLPAHIQQPWAMTAPEEASSASPTQGWRWQPTEASQVASLLHLAQTHLLQLATHPTDAAQLSPPLWLDLSAIKQVLEYDTADLIVKVDAGMTVQDLQTLSASHGHQWPFTAAADALISDILAEERPSLETGLRGWIRERVLGLEIATPDGQLTRCGGRVVKNVTGYDLNKLYVGSHHTLGVLTKATLRLVARPTEERHWLLGFDQLALAMAAAQDLLDSALRTQLTACEVFSQGRTAGIAEFGETLAEHRQKPWQLLIAAGGQAQELQRLEQHIASRYATVTQSGRLQPEWARSLKEHLSIPPKNNLVLEVALPTRPWNLFENLLEPLQFDKVPRRIDEKALPGFSDVQLRPAAGLAWVLWEADRCPEPDAFASLFYGAGSLQTRVQTLGGFVQLLQVPTRLHTGFLALVESLNLPGDPLVRELMLRLKTSYDPHGILYSSRLPLRPDTSLITAATSSSTL